MVVRPEYPTKHVDVLEGLMVLDHVPVASDLDGLAAEVEAADSLK